MALRFNDAERRLSIGVRELIEAGPRAGHLRPDLAQSRLARLQAGREAHSAWQGWRGAEDESFVAEHPVKVALVVRGWECTIRGRVDGLGRELDRPLIEELKTTALDRRRLIATGPEDWPEYTQQVQFYRFLLHASGLNNPLGRLVLVSLLDSSRHSLELDGPTEGVRAMVEARLDWILRQRELRIAHFAARRAASVPFAHAALRPGQAEIVEAARGAVLGGKHLLLTAPTGVGKTATVLHGVLTAAYATDKRVFFATAKGTQQRLVEETLLRLGREMPLRAVSIRAKEKVCLQAEVDCRPEVCPFAANYHDRARPLAEELATQGVHPPESVLRVAEEHSVCPFELSLDLSEYADVVVGDYNYVFNPRSMLRRHFSEGADDWIVVVDEAHNLVERAREQLSPELSARAAALVAQALRDEDPERFRPFIALCEELRQVIEDLALDPEGPAGDGEVVVGLSPRVFRDLRDRVDEIAMDYALLRAESPAEEEPYLPLAWSLMAFVDVLENGAAIGPEGPLVPIFRGRGEASIRLACLDPAPWMGPRMATFAGTVLASATLEPPSFYRDLLGLPEDRVVISRHESPFPPENLGVLLAPRVSTALRDRERHRKGTARLLQELIEATPGNVAVFYSAYALLRELAPLTQVAGRETLQQEQGMDDSARLRLLDRLREIGPPRVLHAVLGGVFAEGVDLPGGVLSAVCIVGPALPVVGLERELMRQRFEDRYGEGFRYAYLVPGMSRVVQAAGRLVRSPTDRGVVVLVERRFGYPDYSAFFPPWWRVVRSDEPSGWVRGFFERSQESAQTG